MVSGQWSGRTTMLSSFCVKTGVVSDQFQFAKEFHDESELTSRQAWLGTLDFEKSTLRQLNWLWLHPTLENDRILRLNEVLYCRCLITNSNEHCINRETRKPPHYGAIQVSKFYFLSQGQYHGMICIMRSSTRSKEDQMIIPSTPDTTSRYEFFW